MLTVEELREWLRPLNPHTKVVIGPNNRYGFAGSIEELLWIPGSPLPCFGEVVSLKEGVEGVVEEKQLKNKYPGAEKVVAILPEF